ncbi:hypothetical protein HDU82_000346 [Entophlyctis luteolus]|nr:hypothetical protein HDU82_000346 [Entophlyctis luteolus]
MANSSVLEGEKLQATTPDIEASASLAIIRNHISSELVESEKRPKFAALKIDTQLPSLPNSKNSSKMMRLLLEGMTTPLSSVSTLLSGFSSSASPDHLGMESSPSATPSSASSAFLERVQNCSWKEIIVHEASMSAIVCIPGLLNACDDIEDGWQFLPAFAPYSDL